MSEVIIVILFLVGGAIVQWVKSMNKDGETSSRPTMPEPFPRQRPVARKNQNPDMDDLMEALGQAPKNKVSGENRIPPSPPPLPRPKPVVWIPEEVVVAKPAPYVPRAEPESVSYESITSHDQDLNKRFAQFSSFDIEDAAAAARLPAPLIAPLSKARQQNRWRADLRSPSTLRKAIVLNEILQPPVAFR